MAVIDNLVAYYSLNEASGDAVDAHGATTLTDTNTVGATTGKVAGCRDFEADNTEYFTAADNAALSVGDIDFSWALWVQVETIGGRSVLVKGNTNDMPYALQTFSSRFEFTVTSGSGFANEVDQFADSFGDIVAGVWNFVVMWHDASANTVNIQVNNGTVDSTSYSFGSYDDGQAFWLGSYHGIRAWDGLIDEAGFWKKVLTAGERTWLYNSGNGRSYSDIVAEGTPADLPPGHTTGFMD